MTIHTGPARDATATKVRPAPESTPSCYLAVGNIYALLSQPIGFVIRRSYIPLQPVFVNLNCKVFRAECCGCWALRTMPISCYLLYLR